MNKFLKISLVLGGLGVVGYFVYRKFFTTSSQELSLRKLISDIGYVFINDNEKDVKIKTNPEAVVDSVDIDFTAYVLAKAIKNNKIKKSDIDKYFAIVKKSASENINDSEKNFIVDFSKNIQALKKQETQETPILYLVDNKIATFKWLGDTIKYDLSQKEPLEIKDGYFISKGNENEKSVTLTLTKQKNAKHNPYTLNQRWWQIDKSNNTVTNKSQNI